MPKASSRIESLLALALLVAAWQFATSALGQTVIISPDVVASRSIDGAGCIMPENEQGQPSQDSAPPNSSSVADLDDLSAKRSTRNDQDAPHSSVTGVGAGAARMSRIVPILLFPVHCFYCLHAHIRERAPPSPVASAKEDPTRGLTI